MRKAALAMALTGFLAFGCGGGGIPSPDPVPVCGNGRVDRGEQCDDRNAATETCAYGQASCTVCDSTCRNAAGATSLCGDGAVNGSEACDDGANNGQPNFCNMTCTGTTSPLCGNSVVESGETCDDGNTNTEPCEYGETACTVCDMACQNVAGAASYCGDGTTDATNEETCDDGNATTEPCAYGQTSCVVCDSTCQDAAGVTAYCGDGAVNGSETCDDGNATSGDGCSSTCQNDALDTNAWITIPAGDFIMGCAAFDTQCDLDESPKHTVYLSAYKIQKYEVTNAQYKQCVDAGTCAVPAYSSSYTRGSYYGDAAYDNFPVIYVDWYEADAYCQWIGGRLPTEAEWEKAARGPSPGENIYPWGNGSPTCSLVNGYVNDYCVGDTSEVGAHPTGASYYGAMGLAGNVWEWVSDWYGSSYYSSSPSSDPQGPTTGSYRVLRGGSWYYYSSILRASRRSLGGYPSLAWYYGGFRCARDF